ncbi:hypothetical protein A9R05_43380 (plasmid) [Burkholderia sp. KK1]|uniref:ParB/Sulfiredoxin domain-containing protein n=1 Tax=Burkholderia sp. M701 TaxID=326454 RepID=V5YQ67_9BURK|nr:MULTISPECIES: hypothetical protein [Burkholderia]AQH05848.1 hypothetical protein A9R05_43380 [Burkholderia sp. KK1]BAO19071.1 hypothetical protein [Burkholderia sp. M701]
MNQIVKAESDAQQLLLPTIAPLVSGNLKNAMKEAGNGSSDLWKITDPFAIKILDNYNVRERDAAYEAYVDWLTGQMMDPEIGFKREFAITVLIVRREDGDEIVLKNGHRRLEAARRAVKAGAKHVVVYAIAPQSGMSEEDMIADLEISNSENTALSEYERAKLCKLMYVYLPEPAEIAKKFGWLKKDKFKPNELGKPDTQRVEGLLMLINGPFVIREFVRTGQVAPTLAIKLMRKHGDKAVKIIEGMVQRAQATGKTKASPKHMTGAGIRKAVTKSAPRMHKAIFGITEDPAWSQLAPDTRKEIEAILAEIKKAEEAESKITDIVDAKFTPKDSNTSTALAAA